MEPLSLPEYSKRMLILAAIKLFSEQGIDGVSLRTINREAGNKNNSALHYHYGSKWGLVESVAEFIQEWFEKQRSERLDALESKEMPANVEEILVEFITPYQILIEEESWGYHAVRFLSKMELEVNPEIHQLLNKHAKKSVGRFKKLLEKALPHLSPKELSNRFNFCLTSIIHGFADYQNLKYSYMGNLKISLNNLTKLYVRYNAAGLSVTRD